jgi:hypothetical protein
MNKNYYRGRPKKGTLNALWVYGAYYEHEPPILCPIAISDRKEEKPKPFIIRTAFADWSLPRQVEHIPIEEGSQGQFTGIMARKSYRGEAEVDLMLFEDDIVEFNNTEGQIFRKAVKWNDKLLCFMVGNMPYMKLYESQYIQPSQLLFEIIGNTLDNPELLLEENMNAN